MLNIYKKYKLLLKNPSQFFENCLLTNDSERNTLQGISLYWFGLFFTTITNLYFLNLLMINSIDGTFFSVKINNLKELKEIMQLQLLISPITAFFWIHIYASIIHATVRIFSFTFNYRNCPINYDTTLYLICVCQIPKIFSFIPIISLYVIPVWCFILLTKALKRTYGLSAELTLFSTLFATLFFRIIWNKTLLILNLLLK